MSNFGTSQVLGLAYIIFSKVKVLCVFISNGGRPDDTSLVVIIDCNRVSGILHMKISGTVQDVVQFCNTLISCHYISLAGAECCPILADGLPANGPPCLANDVTVYTTIFKEWKWSTVRNSVT